MIKQNKMQTKLKHYFWAISLLLCYPLYSIGQVLLLMNMRQESKFYKQLVDHSSEWINSHLFMMLALLFLFPAFLAINDYLKDTKASVWMQLSLFFTAIFCFVLFGQFTIDLVLVPVFQHLGMEQSYSVLEQIQGNYFINALFYDNSKLLGIFKYIDIGLWGQLFLGIALAVSKKVPKWAVYLFFAVLLTTNFAMLIPEYGRLIKRISYAFWSVSFLPIVGYYVKKENKI
jgi:hypothetical protein